MSLAAEDECFNLLKILNVLEAFDALINSSLYVWLVIENYHRYMGIRD